MERAWAALPFAEVRSNLHTHIYDNELICIFGSDVELAPKVVLSAIMTRTDVVQILMRCWY